MDALLKLVNWFVPPTGHDPGVELLYRWRVALFGCLSFFAAGFLYTGLLFEWGPEVIRPASAQTVHTQINAVKEELGHRLKDISDKQDGAIKEQRADRLDRLEQQLLWWRQQNCKSKGEARNYAWRKMGDLKDAYRETTGAEWQMPTCSDIGD